MKSELEVHAGSADDLGALLDHLDDHSVDLTSSDVHFSGQSSSSGTLGAGGFDIVQLILALGSAGAFTALTTVLISYFKARPNATLVIKRRGNGTSLTVTATNVNGKDFADAFRDFAKH